MERSNTVFIGRKPVLNYVLACMTLFKSGHEDVIIKARGQSISRAVDVVEVLKSRFMPNANVSRYTDRHREHVERGPRTFQCKHH